MEEDTGAYGAENHQQDTKDQQIEQMMDEDTEIHEAEERQPDTLER